MLLNEGTQNHSDALYPHLGRMVLHCLQQGGMLGGAVEDLHAAGTANGGVGDVGGTWADRYKAGFQVLWVTATSTSQVPTPMRGFAWVSDGQRRIATVSEA
jgi:hypothetical protein